MKLTKSILKQIIQEELKAVLYEQSPSPAYPECDGLHGCDQMMREQVEGFMKKGYTRHMSVPVDQILNDYGVDLSRERILDKMAPVDEIKAEIGPGRVADCNLPTAIFPKIGLAWVIQGQKMRCGQSWSNVKDISYVRSGYGISKRWPEIPGAVILYKGK